MAGKLGLDVFWGDSLSHMENASGYCSGQMWVSGGVVYRKSSDENKLRLMKVGKE